MVQTIRAASLLSILIFFLVPIPAVAGVVQEDGRTYIIDRAGERWDVTRAQSIGFLPDRFQYGVGKSAFTPLDDDALGEGPLFGFRNPRVIGLTDGETERAYSVPKLSRHEIANSHLGNKAVAAGY